MSAVASLKAAIPKKEFMQIEQANLLTEQQESRKPKLNRKSRLIKYVILLVSIIFIIGLTILLLFLLNVFNNFSTNEHEENECIDSCCVYCSGTLLETIQEFDFFNDSKHFVDMPMNMEPNQILNLWEKNIMDKNLTHNKESVYDFLITYFDDVASDIDDCIPIDFNNDSAYDIPLTLKNRITDNKLQIFASSIYKLWKFLCKTINNSVYQHPSRHSLLPLQNPQMIVAGGRFREIYYWDTFWIIHGLLISDMSISAKITVSNLMNLTSKYGHMLNGNRVYYQNRSQPPLLTFMMDLIYTFEDNNNSFITENSQYLEILKTEYFWWNNQRSININNYTLNLYHINSNEPRPEGFKTDVELTKLLKNQSLSSLRHAYSSLRSSAESGWDFSNRWCLNLYCELDLTNIDTINIIPVELNAYLYHIEITLSKFFALVNGGEDVEYFMNAANKRLDAMYNVFWDEVNKQWNDYDLRNDEQIYESEKSSLASYIPLWLLPYNESIGVDVLTSLNNSGLLYVGGVSTTSVDDNQQWSFPNAWPPLQWIIVQIAKKYNDTEIGQYILQNVTQTYINAAYIGLNQTQFMSEKYNVLNVGESGHGGEYESQLGFGWSNGVALSFLYNFGDWLVAPTLT